MKVIFSFVFLASLLTCAVSNANPLDSNYYEDGKHSRIAQNYPNPFNPTTTIQYAVVDDSYVKIKVCNLAGQIISTIVDGFVAAGTYEIEFDASKLNTGVYMYTFDAKSKISNNTVRSVKRMTVIK